MSPSYGMLSGPGFMFGLVNPPDAREGEQPAWLIPVE